MATKMMTPLDQWLAAESNYLPHYSHTQQVIGSAVLATIVVVTAVVFIVIQYRRRR
jgi:hypothetical protein